MARTHYDNLKVAQTASASEIQRAYRVLAHKWHPDKNTHRIEEAEEYIKIINEAYRVLSNPDLRRGHDTWIRNQESAHAGNYDSKEDEIGRRHYYAEDAQFRTKRKRSGVTARSFRVSKRKFTLFLVSLFGIPAVLGVVVLNAEKFTGFISEAPIAVVLNPASVPESADAVQDIDRVLIEFFDSTNKTLSLITGTETAIAAVPRLNYSKEFIVNFAEQIDAADFAIRTEVSEEVADGLRDLAPQIYRLQRESRMWDILYPTLNPMLQALQRIEG